MPEFFPILVGAIIVLAIVVAIANARYNQKRREELAAFAKRIGWRFDPSKQGASGSVLMRFGILSKGHSHAISNTMHGDLEVEDMQCAAQMGDFRYRVTSGTGKNRKTTTYTLSYLAFRLPFDGVPDLCIRGEHLFDKIGGMIGFDDIDFESEEFSRKFHVQSPDRRFAYDLIHPRMMEFMLAADMPRIDIERGYCLISDGTRRWSPDKFQYMQMFARKFLDHWPPHLVDSLQR